MANNIEILPIYFDYVLNEQYPVVILVGGRNSGKSYFLEQNAVVNLHNCKNYKLMVVEDVETNIGAGVKDGILKRVDEFGLTSLFSATKVPAEINHLNGNSVIFKGYRTETQQKQVKSLNEVTAIWYEEAENITYDQFKALRMQLRGGNEQSRQLFLSLNPVNEDSYINHFFFQNPPDKVIKYFADGRPKIFEKNITIDDEQEGTITITCLVVVSTHRDNPYLSKEQRADIEEYKTTDLDKYAMLAEGKFVKPAGTYFKEFRRDIHTCEPFVIPDHWRRYRTIDYGLDMLACYWVAVDNYGKAYIYKELYEKDLIIKEAADKITQMTNETIYQTFAPGDLWNRRQETGKSVMEWFHDYKIPLTKANNARVDGWLSVKEWLAPYTDKSGKLQSNIVIFNTCTNLIRTLPQLQHDKANPNDVDSKTNHELTHGADALRYFISGRPVPNKKQAQQKHEFFNNTKKDFTERGKINII